MGDFLETFVDVIGRMIMKIAQFRDVVLRASVSLLPKESYLLSLS